MTEAELPAVSVLISTKGRREELERALASLERLDYPHERLEIVVVEETDTPHSIEGVRYIALPEEGKGISYSRNIALKNARHEIVAFTDDDCLLEEKWLRELVGPFERPEVGGVAGAVLVKDTGAIGLCENVLGFPGGGLKYIHRSAGNLQPTRQLSTCNCAYRKNLVEEVGAFEPGSPQWSEDYLLGLKVSERHLCLYNPKAIAYHKPRGGLGAIFRWFMRRGMSDFELSRFLPNPRDHLLRMLLSSLSLRVAAALILLFLLGLLRNWYYPALLVGLYYGFIVYRYRYSYAFYRSLRVLFLVPVVKAVMDLGMDWGRLRAALGALRGENVS